MGQQSLSLENLVEQTRLPFPVFSLFRGPDRDLTFWSSFQMNPAAYKHSWSDCSYQECLSATLWRSQQVDHLIRKPLLTKDDVELSG
jgi:hypothetical protein